LFGSNRIIVDVRSLEEGGIFTADFMTRLKEVTDDVFFLPGVDRRTVTSLWTPNTRYFEITEEGFRADDVIPGTVTPTTLNDRNLDQIRNNVIRGGYVGRLVSNDFNSSLIVAELVENNPETGAPLDYFDLAARLERDIRCRNYFTVDLEADDRQMSRRIGKANTAYIYHPAQFSAILSGELPVDRFAGLQSGDCEPALDYPDQNFTVVVSQGGLQDAVFDIHRDGADGPVVASFSPIYVSDDMELEDGWYTVQAGGVQVLNERGRQALADQQGITYGADDLPVGVFVVAHEGEEPFVEGDSFTVTVERAPIDIHIIGFAKVIGDIADGAGSVIVFFILAFIITALLVFWYSQSIILTLVPLFCSLTSLIWQFGMLHVLGLGLDPLAILVPFLVFAIGVSHGVQQVNLISNEIENGKSGYEAARASFSGLLVPGSMALITDLVGFITLYLIPITMIRELAITATIGVMFKIFTNLVMLPLVVSYFKFSEAYVARVTRARDTRRKVMRIFGYAAYPPIAILIFIGACFIFVNAVVQSQDRHIGDLHAGSPELRPEARYNVDSRQIAADYSIGLNLLTVIVETPTEACIDYEYMSYLNQFSWAMQNVDGVISVASLPFAAKRSNAGWNEGNLKWTALPRNRFALVQATSPIPTSTGLLNANCSLLPVQIYTEDSRATTISTVVHAVEDWRAANPHEDVNIRLASGNVGVAAATNETVEHAELPMILAVYAVIILMVIATYRDWRATIACCVPLTVATFVGYWFMKEIGIGLKVSTLPVIVLAVGLGVDYAFYIYNRVQFHLSEGMNITQSYQQTMYETGMAVVFVALTMAMGVSTWVFSALKFQADMGLLLFFMFMTNMIMAVTVLPSIAVILDLLFKRTKPVRAPAGGH
jgi:predicted RND superfamily exporter protein